MMVERKHGSYQCPACQIMVSLFQEILNLLPVEPFIPNYARPITEIMLKQRRRRHRT